MNDTQRKDEIASLDLVDPTRPLAELLAERQESAASASPSANQPPEAAVVSGSLVAFGQGVSRQNKDDVLDSFLFASLAASNKLDAVHQSDQWYKEFTRVLSLLGWFSNNWRHSRYQSSQRRLSMDEVGLEVIKSAITAALGPGPAALAMLKVAQDALTALSTKEEPLKLFESQTKAHRGGSFRVASCTEQPDGTLDVAMGAVAFRSSRSVTNVLFWEWNSADVDIYKGEDHLTFNVRHYDLLRESVRDKLGEKAKAAIAEFSI